MGLEPRIHCDMVRESTARMVNKSFPSGVATKTDPALLAMRRDAVTPPPGRPSSETTDTISIKDGHGNSHSYTVSRATAGVLWCAAGTRGTA